MSTPKSAEKKNSKGYAMIMVICAMALITVLALSLLLVSSAVIAQSTARRSEQQSRLLAVSVSQSFDAQLTGAAYTFGDAAAENLARDGTLWFYLKDRLLTGAWPYYNEEERGHTSRFAVKTFTLDPAEIPAAVKESVAADAVESIQVQMYWESENGAALDGTPVHVLVSCTVNGKTCTVETTYVLTVYTPAGQENGYEQWTWSLSWRE